MARKSQWRKGASSTAVGPATKPAAKKARVASSELQEKEDSSPESEAGEPKTYLVTHGFDQNLKKIDFGNGI